MRHVPINLPVPCNLFGSNLLEAFKDLPKLWEKALDNRLNIRGMEVLTTTSNSCSFHFWLADLSGPVRGRLMKQKGVLVATIWDGDGKARERVIELLDGRTMDIEMSSSLLRALAELSKPKQKAIDPILETRSVLGKAHDLTPISN